MTTDSTRIPHGTGPETERNTSGNPGSKRREEKRREENEVHTTTHHTTESTRNALAKHVGHRCVPIDDGNRIKCVDCTHTIDLSLRPSSLQPTSTSTSHPTPTPPAYQPTHPGTPMPPTFRAQVQAARKTHP